MEKESPRRDLRMIEGKFLSWIGVRKRLTNLAVHFHSLWMIASLKLKDVAVTYVFKNWRMRPAACR